MPEETSLVPASETGLASTEEIGTPESIASFTQVQKMLAEAAKKRRTRKTHRALKKPRVVGKNQDGSDRYVDTIDRPEFQKWWDDNFPGWSITECKYSTMIGADGKPLLFHCDLMVEVRDACGARRTIPGTGSAPVSAKEVDRTNTQLLTNKRTIAKTNAMKDAAGWLGAFFDLRVDEEARERSMMPPEPEHKKKFAELIAEIPEGFRANLITKWELQNIDSAQKFIDELQSALDRNKQKKEEALKATRPEPTQTPQG